MDYYYTVTTEMTNDLHLKSNNLLVYAIIKAHASGFYGSRSLLANLTGSSLRTIDKSLQYLLERKLIICKREIVNKQAKITYYAAISTDVDLHSLFKYIIKDLSKVSQELYCKELTLSNGNMLTLVLNASERNELIREHKKYFQRQVDYWNLQHKTNFKLDYKYNLV